MDFPSYSSELDTSSIAFKSYSLTSNQLIMRYQSTIPILMLLFLLSSFSTETAAQLGPPAAYTHIAVNNGSWNNPLTWGGSVPNNGAIVQIPSGIRVTLTTQEAARVRYLQVKGEYRHAIGVNTRLLVETMYIDNGGLFRIGGLNNPVNSNRTAEVVFINDGNPIDTMWDPNEVSRGLISLGQIRIYGKTKTNKMEMANDARAGSTNLVTNNTIPSDWIATDDIVLTGTHFLRDTDSQDEKTTISAISGNIINIGSSLQHDHIRANSGTDLHIANLSRNVIFRSESTEPTSFRGHVMIRNSDTDIRYAAFQDLGRTDKSIPLDEIVVDRLTDTIYAGPNLNRRGRYSLHFHLNGLQPALSSPPTKVYGCVVTNAIGWGFVNHGSHVDFQDNVCYNFVGSAFVTETGDELGNFFNNIAIKGTGNGEYRPIRVVFANGERPQPLADFGFSGDGFWFQGPAIRVRDNVATGCNGAGMIWFTTGAVDINTRNYVGFPRNAIDDAYAGFPDLNLLNYRRWSHDTTQAVTADLPILECKNFEAYGCLVGFRLRFNNSSVLSLYGEEWYGYRDSILQPPGAVYRLTQEIEGLKLWNNEQGFRTRYTSNSNWNQVEVYNRIAYDSFNPYAGAELFHQTVDNNFDGLTFDGYAVSGWVTSSSNDNQSEITINNPNYINYANSNSWVDTVPCADIIGLNVPIISSNAARVGWASHPTANRIMLRYKPNGSDYWTYRSDTINPGITTIGIGGLVPGKTYKIQAIAGCPETVSDWSNIKTFNTLVPPAPPQSGNKPLYEVQVYPNPNTDGVVHVDIPKGLDIYDAQLFDLQGKLVLQPDIEEIRGGVLTLDGQFSHSIFILSLYTNEGTQSIRLVLDK